MMLTKKTRVNVNGRLGYVFSTHMGNYFIMFDDSKVPEYILACDVKTS